MILNNVLLGADLAIESSAEAMLDGAFHISKAIEMAYAGRRAND